MLDLNSEKFADQIDRANQINEQTTDVGIRQIRDSLRPNNITECVECGEYIPKPRKIANPSCTRCMSCQIEYEKEKK